MIAWYWWVAPGLLLSVAGMVCAGRALLADYDRPFVAKLITGIVLVVVGAGVGTVPVGFPELAGVSVADEGVCT